MIYKAKKSPEQTVEAVRWSGSNWHEVLAWATSDIVSTDGKNLFALMGGARNTVPKGHWLVCYPNGEFRALTDGHFHEFYEESPRL